MPKFSSNTLAMDEVRHSPKNGQFVSSTGAVSTDVQGVKARNGAEGKSDGGFPMSKYDQDGGGVSSLYESLQHKIDKGEIKHKSASVHPSRILASQSWLSDEGGGGDPVFEHLTEKPVGALDPQGFVHVLDGHHRLSAARANNPNQAVGMHLLPWPWAEK